MSNKVIEKALSCYYYFKNKGYVKQKVTITS